MVSRKALLKVFSVMVLLAFIVGNSGFANVTAQSAPEGQPGTGGNPVVVDAPVAPASPLKPPVDKSTFDKSEIDLNRSVRFIVQLEDAPLASYAGEIQGLQPTSANATGAARLNVNTSAAKAYEQHLARQQEAFSDALVSVLPAARVERSLRVTLNAVVVRSTMANLATLRDLPGVKNIAIEKEYQLQMDASLPLIGLGTGTLGGADWEDSGLWEAVGGHANAGVGIKIADIDSGITPSNPCFSPTGFTMPAGFPKGETAITNAKIIVARSYFRPDDPPFFPASALDDPGAYEGGHGTHTAGTMVCNYDTNTGFSGLEISGLAPKAQLMVYKVFYYSVGGLHSAYTPELVAAIEDAVLDGADVVNNSWGGSNWNTGWDPEVSAYEAAADAGVVVVFSAGNSGDTAMTAGSPGSNSDKFITVAASTTSRTFKTTLEAESRSDAVPTLPADIVGRSVTQTSVTAQIVDLQDIGYADALACNGPLPPGDVSGKIVVVQRGSCALVDKVSNAKAGGAVGVVIRNVAAGTLPLIFPVLPTIHIAQADGDALYSFIHGLPAGVTATYTIAGPAILDLTDVADELASFSSRGPAPDMTLKPDIAAPGVNILSPVSAADFGSTEVTFDFYQGTSMAAPHVTGAAALLRQIHPDWSPAAIRSALMSTAVEPAALGLNPADRGSGRLNLAAPQTVELVFDKPSLGFGLMGTGEAPQTITVKATNTTANAVTYNLAASTTNAGDTPAVSVGGSPITALTVPANGAAEFDVVLTPTLAGVSYGKLTLTDAAGDSPTLHLPYWVRSVVPLPDASVYLVDGDDSGTPGYVGCADVRSAYTDTLTALSISYNVINADEFDFYQARRHDYVLFFDGSSGAVGCGGWLSWYGNDVRNYLAQGGKLIAMGQDLAYWDAYYSYYYGASFTPIITLGLEYLQDNVGSTSDLKVINGGDNPWLDGTTIQLNPANTPSIDEVYPAFFSDLDTLPLFKINDAPGKIKPDGPFVGTRTSSEPTIERVKGEGPWFPVPYRTLYTAFGLENVTDTGLIDADEVRSTLIDSLEQWLLAETNIQFEDSAFASRPVVNAEISVTSTNSVDDENVEYIRFDFGDGSSIQTVAADPSGTTIVKHTYPASGSYTVYAEAVDIYGHKAVTMTTVVVRHHYFMPQLTR